MAHAGGHASNDAQTRQVCAAARPPLRYRAWQNGAVPLEQRDARDLAVCLGEMRQTLLKVGQLLAVSATEGEHVGTPPGQH